jgi:hypothetical protein
MRIVLLTYGSLLWDNNFSHTKFIRTGSDTSKLSLPIEFCRISHSSTKQSYLSLTINQIHGQENIVYYAEPKKTFRSLLQEITAKENHESIKNVSKTSSHISFVDLYHNKSLYKKNHTQIAERIHQWSSDNKIDITVWVSFLSNFKKITGNNFTIKNAYEWYKNHETFEAQKYICSAIKYDLETPFLTKYKQQICNL